MLHLGISTLFYPCPRRFEFVLPRERGERFLLQRRHQWPTQGSFDQEILRSVILNTSRKPKAISVTFSKLLAVAFGVSCWSSPHEFKVLPHLPHSRTGNAWCLQFIKSDSQSTEKFIFSRRLLVSRQQFTFLEATHRRHEYILYAR